MTSPSSKVKDTIISTSLLNPPWSVTSTTHRASNDNKSLCRIHRNESKANTRVQISLWRMKKKARVDWFPAMETATSSRKEESSVRVRAWRANSMRGVREGWARIRKLDPDVGLFRSPAAVSWAEERKTTATGPSRIEQNSTLPTISNWTRSRPRT